MKKGKLENKVYDFQERLTAAKKVEGTLATEGWEVIQALIDKMIQDTIGGKKGDLYQPGLLAKPETTEKKDYFIGYKQALMDLHNRIWNYKLQVKTLEDTIKNLIRNAEKEEEYYQDSKYSPGENETP